LRQPKLLRDGAESIDLPPEAARADPLHRPPDHSAHGPLDALEVGELARAGHLAGKPLDFAIVSRGHVALLLEETASQLRTAAPDASPLLNHAGTGDKHDKGRQATSNDRPHHSGSFLRLKHRFGFAGTLNARSTGHPDRMTL